MVPDVIKWQEALHRQFQLVSLETYIWQVIVNYNTLLNTV